MTSISQSQQFKRSKNNLRKSSNDELKYKKLGSNYASNPYHSPLKSFKSNMKRLSSNGKLSSKVKEEERLDTSDFGENTVKIYQTTKCQKNNSNKKVSNDSVTKLISISSPQLH